MPSLTFVRRAIAASIVAVAAAAIALPASAHAELISSDPADGATVSELTTVHFEFSEDLLDIGNSVVVTGGDGTSQDATLTFPKPNQMDAAVADVAPGEVTIAWRNASVDGHTEEGELHVTLVGEATTPSATPTPAATPTPSATPTPQATFSEASPEAEPAQAGGLGWLWIGLGVVVVAAVAIAVAVRRPRSGS